MTSKMTQFHYSSINHIWLPISAPQLPRANMCTLYHFQEIMIYWLKMCIFLSHLHLNTYRVTPANVCRSLVS